MRPTPTPLDCKWLHQQITRALAAAGDASTIALPRPTVELMVCVLDVTTDGYVRPTKAVRYQIDDADLRPTVLLELKRLATPDGEAPSKSRWDQQRQTGLPTAQHLCRILGERWPHLCLEAGLLLNRHAQRSAWRVDAQPPAAEEDAAEQAPILTEDDYGELAVTSRRTEIVTAGNIRTTRVYNMLR